MVDLTKKYGSFTAVNNLSLNIHKGEVFGLLGPNGAGKSTTILMLLGLTDPTSGLVSVCGINSTMNPIDVKRKVGYLPEDVGFYDNRTGMENLLYTARLNGIADREALQRAEKIMERIGLADAVNKKAGKYSRGMRQRLGLADVLIKNPEVIVQLSKAEGLTVLFSSHHLHQVQQVCDRVGLLVNGKLIAEGDIQSLSKKLFTNSPYVIEAGIVEKVHSTDWLSGILKTLDGITAISLKHDIYEIECSKDLST